MQLMLKSTKNIYSKNEKDKKIGLFLPDINQTKNQIRNFTKDLDGKKSLAYVLSNLYIYLYISLQFR